ncbi:MAG: DNA-protecting protein DprA [Acetobacteraceae bacterium]|nr:DNA-protecting protein DprA [Acetobacteraceae bacterium]
MNAQEIRDRLRLVRTEGVGPITYRRLLNRYRSATEALDALPGLARAGGRASPLRIPRADAAERELELLAGFGARLLWLGEPDYPALLGMLDGAPPALSVLGDVTVLNAKSVALVGARNASTNGKRMAELLAADLAAAGLVVVSGMARGIDTAAHIGALRAGRTVAAIAGGIDVVYPPENAELQRRVAENGAVVAEAPFGTAPQARHFPRRNRIIAGLSLGVIVVEAAPRSGSLITARLAADMGRDLFAVPGSPLDPRCRGSNDLIRAGAQLVESASDVLQNLPEHPKTLVPPPGRPGVAEPAQAYEPTLEDRDRARRVVLENLGHDPTPIDDLVRRCQLSASSVVAALLELELGGRLEVLPGNKACLLA